MRQIDSLGLYGTTVTGAGSLSSDPGPPPLEPSMCCCPRSLELEWDSQSPNNILIKPFTHEGVTYLQAYAELTTKITLDWEPWTIYSPCTIEWFELSNEELPGNKNKGQWGDIAKADPVPDDLEDLMDAIAEPGAGVNFPITNLDIPNAPYNIDLPDFTYYVFFAVKLKGGKFCNCDPTELTEFASLSISKKGRFYTGYKTNSLPASPHFFIAPPF